MASDNHIKAENRFDNTEMSLVSCFIEHLVCKLVADQKQQEEVSLPVSRFYHFVSHTRRLASNAFSLLITE